jgi:hypothetical protein
LRSSQELERALALLRQGLTATEVSRATGIPRSTVRDWGYGRGIERPRDLVCPGHDFSSIDGGAYAYLLAVYLGDGFICPRPRGVWQLRNTLDSTYPGIIAECVRAVEAVAPRKAYVLRRRHERAVEVSKYWKHWTCFIPQHGPGRKHTRPIVLADWQTRVVETHVEQFLRGLIHSDGTRMIATERKGSYVRRAPRYAFKTDQRASSGSLPAHVRSRESTARGRARLR